jgi:hypothetical protein
MTPNRRAKTLTGTVTTHVTSDEEKQMKERARELGVSKSEWCRRTLLNALNAASETKLIMAELAAMRALFLTLHMDAVTGADLSADRLRMMVEQADREKYALAEKRIQTFRLQEGSSVFQNNKEAVA